MNSYNNRMKKLANNVSHPKAYNYAAISKASKLNKETILCGDNNDSYISQSKRIEFLNKIITRFNNATIESYMVDHYKKSFCKYTFILREHLRKSKLIITSYRTYISISYRGITFNDKENCHVFYMSNDINKLIDKIKNNYKLYYIITKTIGDLDCEY